MPDEKPNVGSSPKAISAAVIENRRKESGIWLFKYVNVKFHEKGLYFRGGEFKGFLGKGRRLFFDVVLGEKGLAERIVNLL